MSSFKGILGETVINVAMWIKLDKDIYQRLNNVTLALANGGSTQIDHVIVSVYGIFVIETKKYKGWIYGKESQKQWTQAFPNGRKYKFQNPLRQNYLHIKTLADLLGLDMSYFHSMIAFIGECELKTRDELPENVLTSGMASYVKKKHDKLLTEEEVKAIVEQIENNRFSKSWRTNREHKAYLKDKHSGQPKKTNAKSHELKPKVKERVTTREVQGWSGQTQLDNEPLIVASTKEELFYITPFELPESIADFKTQPESKAEIDEPLDIKELEKLAAPIIQTKETIASETTPSCPKCESEMIKRVAKKGTRQGQIFYGCSQFPKCRGVINSAVA